MPRVQLPAALTPAQTCANRSALPRLSVILRELHYLILSEMPGVLAYANEQDDLGIAIPQYSYLEPDGPIKVFPAWTVTMGETLRQWSPTQLKGDGDAAVAYFPGPTLAPADRLRCSDALDQLNTMLLNYIGGLVVDGLSIWNTITPGVREWVKIPQWDNAQGLVQHFDAAQFPNEKRWPSEIL
jgi:hypothetical protein